MGTAKDKACDGTLREKLIRALFKLRKFALSVTQMLDVSLGEFFVLKAISDGEEFRISEAMDLLNVTKPAVSQILNNLEKKGYVTRRISASDRRRINVSLTESGLEAVGRLKGFFNRALEEIELRIGEEDLSRLIELLDRFESVSAEPRAELCRLMREGEIK